MLIVFPTHLQANLEHAVDENNTLTQRLNQAQQDNENQLMHSEQLAKENSQKSAELKVGTRNARHLVTP